MELVERVLRQDQRAIARCLSLVEAGGAEAQEVIGALYPHTGQAHLIGVTGAPGSGKSTLISALAREYLRQGIAVGIIAIDPSSPFSGGAILGDRLRIQPGQPTDARLFIRSMANRGRLGGLSQATGDAVQVLDAAGFAVILVETVGAGQDEVDVARVAHSTLVLQTPGMGDDIQAIKAGILEIADIYVVNKADRPGADELVGILEGMTALAPPSQNVRRMRAWQRSLPYQVTANSTSASWETPVLKTVASTGEGVTGLLEALDRHAAHLRASGQWALRECERVAAQLLDLLQETLLQRFLAQRAEAELAARVEQVASRQTDLYTALRQLLADSAGLPAPTHGGEP